MIKLYQYGRPIYTAKRIIYIVAILVSFTTIMIPIPFIVVHTAWHECRRRINEAFRITKIGDTYVKRVVHGDGGVKIILCHRE